MKTFNALIVLNANHQGKRRSFKLGPYELMVRTKSFMR